MTTFGFSTTSEEAAKHFQDEIRGRTVLVTGASPKGLGAQFAKAIAPYQPKLLILAGRTPAKIEETIKDIKTVAPEVNARTLKLDLASLKQIRGAAQEVNSYSETVDVVVNNAGIMATPYYTTEDGFESQFGSNHIGHFVFTNLLLPKMLKSGQQVRVVNVTSNGHQIDGVRFHDPGYLRGAFYNKWTAYGQSKTANILYTKALAKRLGDKGVSVAVHPGQIAGTSLGGGITEDDLKAFGWNESEGGDFLPWKPKELTAGAATHVVGAFDPSLKDNNGSYLSDCQVHDEEVAEWATGDANAEKLWALSEQLVKQKFDL